MKNYRPISFVLIFAFLFFFAQFFSLPKKIITNPTEDMSLEKGSPNLKTFSMDQDHLLRALDEIQNRKFNEQGLAQDMEWLEKGPVNIGGRTRVFLIDRRDTTENTVIAAGVSGGLWKTENFMENELIRTGPDGEQIREGGTRWQAIPFDFPNLGICALVQDPNDLEVFYAGTGEFWTASGVDGAGIWKSSDGGNHWEHLSSTANQQFTFVNRLLFDKNGFLLAATADAGVLRSKDGGQSWETVLDSTSGTLSNIAADIELAANGDLYASFGGWNEYDHLYKSSSGSQAGDLNKWERIVLPDTLQRKEIACAPGSADRVYVIGAENSLMSGFYVSDDGGKTWESKPPSAIDGGQANYNMVLAVSPSDPDFVRAGGVRLFSSQNAGDSWEYTFNGHADQHFIQFNSPDPDFPHRAITAQDGGFNHIWGDGIAFNRRNKNYYYKTTQFYGIALHPGIGSNEIIGGTQDNGTIFFDEPGEEKVPISNGDSGFPHIDQDEPHLRILNLKTNNYVVISKEDGDEIGTSRTILLDSRASFINANDYDDINNTLYAATTQLAAFLRIKNVFEETPQIDYVNIQGLSGGLSATSVDVSPNAPTTLYLGAGTRLFRVNNASDGLSVEADLIFEHSSSGFRNVAIEKNNEDHIIASLLSTDENEEYLWQTQNSTSENPVWESFQGDLPKIPVFWVIFMPGNTDQAIAGTEFGIWVTENIDGSNTHWEQCRNGIPNVRITHLIHRPSDDRIAAASYGRGVFYTQFFEQTYAFFTNDSLQIEEEEILTDTECRNVKEIGIPVELSKRPESEVVVTINVDSSATSSTAGQDYELPEISSISFSPESALRQFYKLKIFDDAVLEDTEHLNLTLSINSSDITLSQASFVIEIRDNDPPIRYDSTPSTILEERWNERVDFINKEWEHFPTIRDLQINQTSYNVWRGSELCNEIDVFSASLWYYNGPEFRFSCGYNNELPTTSIMYREVDARNHDNLQVKFDWLAGGQLGEDFGSLVYSTTSDPFNWISLPEQYAEQSKVQSALIDLPDSLNDRTFFLGWQWVNSSQGDGQNSLAMSVDNIRLNGDLLPTRAESEPYQVSEYVGPGEEVLFFSKRERLMASILSNQNENPGCTSIELQKEEGTSLTFENDQLAGFLLPISFRYDFENSGTASGEISLFFRTKSINAFLSDHKITEDSLEVYFLDGDKLERIPGISIANVALTKKFSVNTSFISGTFFLGWLQKVPCTAISSMISATICQGQAFEGYQTSGTFQDQFTAANGCDSIRTLQLSVLQPVNQTISATICQGQAFEGYQTSGTFQDQFTAANGCDSIRTLQLSVLQPVNQTISATICQGQAFEGYQTSGTFQDQFTAANGCDSIRTLQLSVLQPVNQTISATICQGQAFEGYQTSGTFQDQFTAANGCDSIRTLQLSVLQPVNQTISATICQGQAFEGYQTSGTFQDQFTAANGCDSIRTLNLEVIPSIETIIDTSICAGSSFEGYLESGSYQDVFQAINGCDSIRIVNLTIRPDTDMACQTTNTSETIVGNKISFFPNPARDKLQVKWTSEVPIISYRLFDVLGTLLSEGQLFKNEALDLTRQSRGMYYLHISDGEKQVVKRFLKL